MSAIDEFDMVVAVDIESGEELWRYSVGPRYVGHDGSHDGPIATPAIDGDTVCSIGPRGELFCLRASTGKELWRLDVQEELGAPKPWYGFTSSPLIVGDLLVAEFAADEKSLWAFDLETGELAWSTGGDEVSYQSPILIDLGGEQQILSSGNAYLYGIDPKSGEVQWKYEHGGDGRAIGSESLVPVPVGDRRFFLNHKADESKVIELELVDGAVEVEEVWSNSSIKTSYTVPVYHDGYLYGFSSRILVCVDASNGEIVWRSREPGDGFLILVEGHLVIQTKKGPLHIAQATPEAYTEVSQIDLFGDHSWTTASWADGSLFARSLGEMARVSLGSDAVVAGVGSGIEVPEGMESSFFMLFVGGALRSEDPMNGVDGIWRTIDVLPIREGDQWLHFLYRGEAEDMALVSDLTGARHAEPMNRIPGTDFFFYSAVLDPAARFSYHFVRNFDEPIVDELNPNRFKAGELERNWYAMPGWQEPAYLTEPATAAGSLDSIELTYGEAEEASVVDVYLPAGYEESEDRYPALYVLGGEAALEDGSMAASLDYLIESGAIEPMIGVFVHRPNLVSEEDEAPGAEVARYAGAVAKDVVAAVDLRYRTRAAASSRAAFGAGWDGFQALYTTFAHPDVFGKAAIHSAYMLTNQEVVLEGVLKESSDAPLDVYLDWGVYDNRSVVEGWDMAAAGRKLQQRLQTLGYEPMGAEATTGTGWNNWKTLVGRSLEALFSVSVAEDGLAEGMADRAADASETR